MEGILHRYAKSFPFLKPYLDFDPSKMDDITFERDDKEKLKYLPALQPAEFAMLVPPLFLEKEAKVDSSFMAPIWSPDDGVGFDEELAERSFKKQLGLHFTGTDNMTSTEKKVFNILVDRLTFNKAEMQTLIKKMAVVICKNKGSFKGKIPYVYSELDLFNKLLDIYNGYVEHNKKSEKDKKNPDIIKNNKYINRLVYSKEMETVLKNISGDRIMSEHAFTYCGLMSMLEKGREGGVIEPVTIQWVKLENRTLFFALNSVGKKVSFVESAGIFAHWLLELHIGRPVPTAEVSEAVIGLKTSLYIEEQNS
jgi:transcription elongation factor Elf1